MRNAPVLESPFLLDLESLPGLPEGPARWQDVFGRRRPLRLEVGVGNSPFLIELARLEPEFDYLGFEYSRKRVEKFLRRVHDARLDSIRVLPVHFDRVLPFFEPESVEHVFVNFPDPWPRRRQGKKRFIRPERIRAVNRILAPGGGLSLRTDATDYAREALEVLERSSELESVAPPGGFAPSPRYPLETPYEVKFKRAGLRIYYLEYRKSAQFRTG